jgi:hypothetical protein
MGGSIGFTIREENGTEHRMCRWTNPTPGFINHSKLIECDKNHLDEYLKTWYDMVAEFESGEYKNKQMTMADVYAPNPFLAPMSYGLIVVDYKTKTILHLQGYTSYGRILPSSLSLALLNVENGWDEEESRNEVNDFKHLFETGRIKKAEVIAEEGGLKEIDISEMKYEEVLEQCTARSASKGTRFYMIKLDMSPWTVKRFKENSNGVQSFKTEVLNLGFVLTEEENKIWKDFEDTYKRQEEEDGDEEE